MKKSRLIPWILSSTILSGLLAGCGSTATTAAPTSTAAVIALAPQTAPNWWFPITSDTAFSDLNMQMNALMYLPLVHISRHDDIDYAKSLAKTIVWNPSGTVYTITLNPQWHWSNGRPVTAKDVVWTIKMMLLASRSSTVSWNYGGAGIGGLPTSTSAGRWQSVTAPNAHTVVITLSRPSNPQWFIRNGLGQVTPVPISLWKHGTPNQTMNFIKSVSNTPQAAPYQVVDGPFKFDAQLSKIHNQYWTFVPNPHFNGIKPQLSRVIFQYESSDSAEFSALKTGKVTVGYLPSSMWAARHQLTNDTLFMPYLFGFTFLQPNDNAQAPGGLGPVFQKAYVRQALEMGIDQPAIIHSLYHGHAIVETGPIPPKPATVFDDSALNSPLYPYNPAAGKKLLESHGWVLKNGVLTKGTHTLAFTVLYMSGSDTDASLMQLIQQDWAKEGVRITLKSEPFNNVLSTAQQTDPTQWNMAFWGASSWTYEPDYYPTGGSFWMTGAGANQGGYNNQTMDRLIQASYQPGSTAQ
ncbi:MAG: peptide ABC transporter substrate-binding protein, partial [Firmicutes bacterium]|nr:peptide ABC transporter substrate-binding protein [Bacillota bacterium]